MSQDTPLLEPDNMVDQFRVLRLLGRGGMGEVYLARDMVLGRRVALKLIKSGQERSGEAIARFLREARLTASLCHPNVVTIHAAGSYQGWPYLALEYVEGDTLRDRLRQARPGTKEAIRIGHAIALGLAEAHGKRVLHRDLKPENILMAKDGRLRILDFGLAKVVGGGVTWENDDPSRGGNGGGTGRADAGEQPSTLESGSGSRSGSKSGAESAPASESAPALRLALGSGSEPASESGPTLESDVKVVYGTPAYLAPEQWRGEGSTEASDIWMLGSMLHELVGGKRPYEGLSPGILRFIVAGQEPVPRLHVQHAVPAQLVELIARCLAKDPKGRPSASEVAEQLELMLLDGARQQTSKEHNPFRGLFAFTERHSDVFFGREQEVGAFLESMREQPVLPVVGPSGAGKSSFIQAGVIPRLREQCPWIVLQIRPGNDPFAALAARLERGETLVRRASSCGTSEVTEQLRFGLGKSRQTARLSSPSSTHRSAAVLSPIATEPAGERSRPGLREKLEQSPYLLNVILHQLALEESSKVLLFVDQLEEVYTLVADESVRVAFMQAICGAADDQQSPVRVVFTVRDDFLGRIAQSIEGGEILSRVTVVRRPNEEMLREILCRPVELVGYSYQDDKLVGDMIQAVRGEPACLPLLQFTGRMLWDSR
ncbi:MAG: serine/threonine-protein kinase, partial [Pseudomonadota bacterium]